MSATSGFFRSIGIGVAALCACVAMVATYCVAAEAGKPSQPANDLPRYRLMVGQELVYEQTADEDLQPKTEEEKKTENVYETKLKWWIWVTKQNENGGWRLLIRKRIDNFVTHPGKERESRFENDVLGYCDIAPNGQFERNDTIVGHPFFRPRPGELFVELPVDMRGLADGWNYTSPADDANRSLKITKRADDLLHFAGSETRPTDRNYELTSTLQIDFDTHRGLLTKIVDESKADWKTNPWHNRKTIELLSAKDRGGDWMASLAAEGDAYLAAQRKSDALAQKAHDSRTKAACQALLNDARGVLVECQAKSQVPEIRSIVDQGLKRFDIDAKDEVKNAAKREELYAKPAMDWETTDLDGKPQKLVDYRGKIVLLDFWYRGCGHCIEALPKVKKLVSNYEGKNVVVLGVNNNDDVADAQFVIKAYELKHKNIHAEKLPDQYDVNAWPTFIVLDQTGRIADYHEGNSEDLYAHVVGVVDQLLEHAPAAIKEPPGW
jgi:thiol-disulfide isomerase/thioredoxin